MMRDPVRIIQGNVNDPAVRLMHSVRRDGPSVGVRQRTLAALGASAAIAIAGKATATTLLVASAKWLAVATGLSLAALGIAHSVIGPKSSSSGVAGKAPVVWVQDNKTNPTPAETTTAAASVQIAQEAAAPDAVRALEAPGLERATASPSGRPTSKLAREVAALDRARAAALAHQPLRVIALLDAYQHEFPNGALGPEAQVLRIEALAGSGQLEKARTLAQKLLAADPTGPLADRVRALVPAGVAEKSKSGRSNASSPATSQ
jgi:hypothetical protein